MPLITALNELPQVKVCGHLGMCFNCRNKYLKMGDKLIRVHKLPNTTSNDIDLNALNSRHAKSMFMQRSESTPNTLFNNLSLKKLCKRFDDDVELKSTTSQRPMISTPSLPLMQTSRYNWRGITNKSVNFHEEL